MNEVSRMVIETRRQLPEPATFPHDQVTVRYYRHGKADGLRRAPVIAPEELSAIRVAYRKLPTPAGPLWIGPYGFGKGASK